MSQAADPGVQNSSTVLITGLTGWVGTYLADFLHQNFSTSLQLHGITLSNKSVEFPGLTIHHLDLADTPNLTNLLEELRPSFIFHLAARSFVGSAISNPGLTLNTNLNISLSLFEAVRLAGLGPTVRILNAGSGDQYGFVERQDLPVRETTPFRPGNPYAVSKIAQEMLGYQYYRSYRLHIVNTRAFNHIGPGQSAELAAGAFARQIALAETGQIEPVLHVGNLEARRDYTDVRDIVRGYWQALQPAQPGYSGCQAGEAYNLCSGVSRSIGSVLNLLIGLARCPLQVQPDPTRLRPSDVPVVEGEAAKFRSATGWQPQIPFEQSLTDLLSFWRAQVGPG